MQDYSTNATMPDARAFHNDTTFAAIHAEIVGMTDTERAELVLRETRDVADDPRWQAVRLAVVAMAGTRAGLPL